MGLIRNAAIVAVAITLIPADPQDRAHLYAKAHDGMTWAMTFCDRNKTTCEKGHEFKDAFLEKASFAASAAYDIALVQLTGATDQRDYRHQRHLRAQDQQKRGTLTAFDREVSWRGHH